MRTSVSGLFEQPAVNEQHPVFAHLRDSKFCEEDRRVIEELWCRFQTIADSNFPAEFQRQTPSRIWEMRLGCALLNLGFEVTSEDAGPDLRVSAVQIEAIAVEPGEGDNRVPDLQTFDPLADVGLKLRWRYFQGFIQKASKFRRYLNKGLVKPSDCLVVAISASKIPEAAWEDAVPLPPIVEACFGVSYSDAGDPTLRVGKEHKVGNPKDIPNFFLCARR